MVKKLEVGRTSEFLVQLVFRELVIIIPKPEVFTQILPWDVLQLYRRYRRQVMYILQNILPTPVLNCQQCTLARKMMATGVVERLT